MQFAQANFGSPNLSLLTASSSAASFFAQSLTAAVIASFDALGEDDVACGFVAVPPTVPEYRPLVPDPTLIPPLMRVVEVR